MGAPALEDPATGRAASILNLQECRCSVTKNIVPEDVGAACDPVYINAYEKKI